MKKILIITGTTLAMLIVLAESGVLDSLLIFLLAGQVPGTEYTIPSSFMLLAIISIIWLVVFRFAGLEVSHSITTKRGAKRQAERKKRMPKRRYAQILSLR